MTFARLLVVLVAVSACVVVSGCRHKAKPYQSKPAWSGTPVSLPDVPNLPAKQVKDGDAYTVWGASHQLRSVVHSDSIKGKDIAIVGWVVKTNFAEAPACAVHPTGKADKDGCDARVPAFWISDSKDDTVNAIKVLGFASNYANVYDQIKKDQRAKAGDKPHEDSYWGTALPMPTPNVGAKVKVKGNYGYNFTKTGRGIESDPRMGLLTYASLEYVEKPPEPAKLPGMK